MNKFWFVCVVLVFLGTGTLASLTTAASKGWAGEVSLSGSNTSGNTSTTDLGVAIQVKKTAGRFKHALNTVYDFGTASGDNNKNRWSIEYRLDYKVSKAIFIFASGSYYTDQFGAFQNSLLLSPGFGFQILDGDKYNWNIRAGAGYRSQTDADSIVMEELTEGTTVNEGTFTGGSEFSWKINENVDLSNDTQLIWADSDTYIGSDIGLNVRLSKNLSGRVSFRVEHHTQAPVGSVNTDTATRFSVSYKF